MVRRVKRARRIPQTVPKCGKRPALDSPRLDCMVIIMFAHLSLSARRCSSLACLALFGVLACRASDSRHELGPEPSRATVAAAALPAVGARDGEIVTFEGTCDASGAIALDTRHFAVADDEDNVLRIYDAEAGGAARASFELSSALSLEP